MKQFLFSSWILISMVAFTGLRVDAKVKSRIVNGINTSDHPSAGALLKGGDPLSASSWCSGTLIGCNTFLTAGHCVEGNTNPTSWTVFLQHGGLFKVTEVHLHPNFNFPISDVAVIKLEQSVTGISPALIDRHGGHADGQVAQIVGFGRSGGADNIYGIKRFGGVNLVSCDNANDALICWNFKAPLGNPGKNSNTCNGDSGGPLFLDSSEGLVVAGITSGGNYSCLPDDQSYDARVSTYANFIDQYGGADLNNQSCGDIAPVGGSGTQVTAFSDSLNAQKTESLHQVDVVPGTDTLRISSNGNDSANYDFYVQYGDQPSPENYLCAATGSGQFGFCEIKQPQAGTWNILVKRVRGKGEYQVTVTTFAKR